jgi:hypothetical protein
LVSSCVLVEREPLFASERKTVVGAFRGDKEAQREIDAWLHDLSQPMTVLLCLLEHGSELEGSDELKQMLALSVETAEKLRVIVSKMQSIVQTQRGK